jgi:hypothetical protein
MDSLEFREFIILVLILVSLFEDDKGDWVEKLETKRFSLSHYIHRQTRQKDSFRKCCPFAIVLKFLVLVLVLVSLFVCLLAIPTPPLVRVSLNMRATGNNHSTMGITLKYY